jgi:hypothetical protein
MLELAIALLVLIKVLLLSAVHVQILTVSYVMLSAVVNVSRNFIPPVMLMALVLITVNSVRIVSPARPALIHIYFKIVNASLRVMILVLLLMQVERFSLVIQDAKHAS